jgi:hypothetical protein
MKAVELRGDSNYNTGIGLRDTCFGGVALFGFIWSFSSAFNRREEEEYGPQPVKIGTSPVS